MQLENRQTIRLYSHGCFNVPRVLIKNFFASRDDLRRDREAVTRRRPGEDWSVLSLFELIRFLRDSNCAGLFPYLWFHASFLSPTEIEPAGNDEWRSKAHLDIRASSLKRRFDFRSQKLPERLVKD